MKRTFSLVLVLLFLLIQSGLAEAGESIKINFTQNSRAYELREFRSDVFPVGAKEVLAEKKKMLAYVKANKVEINKKITELCKKHYFYNSRIKIKDARGGTAGLGNLKGLKIENVKVSEVIVSYDVNISLEESEIIEAEYPDITTWPGWIENGYVVYMIESTCRFSSSISIVSSVAYEVFIKDDAYGEYSRSELAKKKWVLNYKSPD
jgi:hypothetical protein